MKNIIRKATVIGMGLLLPVAGILLVAQNDESFVETNAASSIKLAEDIQVGDTIIFTAQGIKREFAGVIEDGTGAAKKYTGSTPSGRYEFVVEQGAYDNTFAFKNSDGLYLSTNFSFFSFLDDKVLLDDQIDSFSSFTVEFTSKGNALVSVTPFLTTKYLCYDVENKAFDYSIFAPVDDYAYAGITIYSYDRQVNNLKVEPSFYSKKSTTVITKPSKVTATVAGYDGVEYNNYFALIGSLNNGEFVQREVVVFDKTVITEADNIIRFVARDATTIGGNSFAFYDAPIQNDEVPLTSAKEYAQYFLDTVKCDGYSIVSCDWSDLQARFEALSSSAQELLVNANEDSDEVIKAAVERYDFIVKKYQSTTYSDFMNRAHNTSMANFTVVANNNSSITAILLVVTLMGMCSALFLLKRKKNH